MTNHDQDLKELLRRTALTLKYTQAELKEAQAKLKDVRQSESIAIIGIGCRFPGGANSPKEFWSLLQKGFDGISTVPKQRWDVQECDQKYPEVVGKEYCHQGGFLSVPVDAFDADFYGISPQEAEWMDPQQRLLLELSWEAIENAALDPESIVGSSTGVFIGVCLANYKDLIAKTNCMTPYLGTGIAPSILAGRISYFLGAQGPSIVVDTACSSSLVAVHNACMSLQAYECHMALAGGVSLMLSPEITVNFCQANILSPKGHCRSFDAKADGFVRGEGGGIVILKRLSDAIKDRDRILAVIRSSGVNQNGSSSALTAPNGEAQKSLIKRVLLKGGLTPNQIQYVEAHGSGTSFGDAIEGNAIAEALKVDRQTDQRLVIGSVKTNIGYLEAASGIAGLIKVVLALQHEEIPAHRNFENLNPLISFDSIPAIIPTQNVSWSRHSIAPRLAGINSFGFCGTNAHAILEEAPEVEIKSNTIDRPMHLITFSAKNPQALNELISSYILCLEESPELVLADVAYTANAGRRHFGYRAVCTASSTAELLIKLKSREIQQGQVFPGSECKLAFVFSDNRKWPLQQGKHLYMTSPPFKGAIEESATLIDKLKGPSLEKILFEGGQTDDQKLVVFVLQYALAKLWISFGVMPDYAVSNGVGNYVAAVIGGMMHLDEALKLLSLEIKSTISSAANNEFVQAVEQLNLNPSSFGIISTCKSHADNQVLFNKQFWIEQASQFIPDSTMHDLCKGENVLFLEMTPTSGLAIDHERLNPSSEFSDTEDWTRILQTLSQLYLRGIAINWTGYDSPYYRNKLSLPTYPFQRQHYWIPISQ